ncbi:MAG: hypothetical protein QUS13_04775 [Smithella sp.]|nr:hypothetical protein [Smithella sp.]
MKKKQELILEVGAAGGSLSVWSSTNKEGNRSFLVKRDESPLKALMEEKDAKGIKFTSTSGQLQSFADALIFLGQYPWHRLYPMFVHHDFIDPVLAAVMTLGGQKELDRWKQRIKYVNELDRKQD